ncbi:hypothetical protein PR048_015419, partial [Dryococelus australis]
MSSRDYEYLLGKLSPNMRKQDTHMRKPISPSERLTLTLRFLASVTTISRIIPDVCSTLYEVLKVDYLKVQKYQHFNAKWYKEAEDFEQTRNLSHCLAALEGNHVVFKGPENSGSLYYNYKGTHGVVLLALVNARYEFLYEDCSSSFALENNLLNIPDESHCQANLILYLADDAFALTPHLMKPFPFKHWSGPNRVFTYRLSRTRHVVENAFGLIAATFRILRRPVELPPPKMRCIVLAIKRSLHICMRIVVHLTLKLQTVSFLVHGKVKGCLQVHSISFNVLLPEIPTELPKRSGNSSRISSCFMKEKLYGNFGTYKSPEK